MFFKMLRLWPVLGVWVLQSCIAPDNEVIEGMGTPDITQCSTINGVGDGAMYEPLTAIDLTAENKNNPDVFYLAWAKLDARSDLRFPEKGYDDAGFEDKLLVSRRANDGTVKTWQLLPQLDDSCKDVEKIRIHSFDVAPNGRSLYLSMARTPLSGAVNRDSHLGIYRFDIKNYELTKISTDNNTHFMHPTYIGNAPDTRHEMLLVAKTVKGNEIPVNYRQGDASAGVLKDEYDRSPTTLIHKMDTFDGNITRIGFNNSHQTEPFLAADPDGHPIAVFTQWEHQDALNRFSLWKIQIDGSDAFVFYGDEATANDSTNHLFQGRLVRSGQYKNYILMTESHNFFDAEGHVLMTKRKHLDLRSKKIYLQKKHTVGATSVGISRNPEYYNDSRFVYSHRADTEHTYDLYIKAFPADGENSDALDTSAGDLLSPETNDYHFVQARSFYPPEREQVVPTARDLGQNRISFTNENLQGASGFLMENLTQSDNGVQHQLDGIAVDDIALQFFVPSHHLAGLSTAIGLKNSPEMTIPASGFLTPESDGSFGAILKNGLYVWKVHKRFDLHGENVWIPIRAERQEVSFVPDRVNACNQCHQERSQYNLDLYHDSNSIATQKMTGNLQGAHNITNFPVYDHIPDFHQDIMPLFLKKAVNPDIAEANRQSCADCHQSGTKLNLSNPTGVDVMNATYRTLVKGARNLGHANIAYSSDAINPMMMDANLHPAPFMWSVLLNDDLTVENPAQTTDTAMTPFQASRRTLKTAGDYGASYNKAVLDDVQRINGLYDHSKHWSAQDMQTFITYGTSQLAVGLSHHIDFKEENIGAFMTTAAAQKAYQVMVRQCYGCHNNFWDKGIRTEKFGLPLEKRWDSDQGLIDTHLRFVMKTYSATKDAGKFSQYSWQSDLNASMRDSLASASHRIDFNDKNRTDTEKLSELLVYARCVDGEGQPLTPATHHVKHNVCLSSGSADYGYLSAWAGELLNKTVDNSVVNHPPTLNTPFTSLTFAEYDPPALSDAITWSDVDGDLAQLFLQKQNWNENDTMVSLVYDSYASAKIQRYAILGDRGTHNLKFTVSDGQSSQDVSQNLTVTVSAGDYTVPTPSATFPNAWAYYTVRNAMANSTTYNIDDAIAHASNIYTLTDSIANISTKVYEVEDVLGNLGTVFATEDALGNISTTYKVLDAVGHVHTVGELRKLSIDAGHGTDTLVGVIDDYNNDWSTVYRRKDTGWTRGWLYFVEQKAQKIHVVDESNAKVLFHINLNHEPNRYSDSHKQTQYLLWWRDKNGLSAETDWLRAYNKGNGFYQPKSVVPETQCGEGELQGLLESKLSSDTNHNGDFYIGLGCGELVLQDALGNPSTVLSDKGVFPSAHMDKTMAVVPEWRTKLENGDNTLSVYVWRRATFMTRWLNDSVDDFNVLNLVSGKAKALGAFKLTDLDTHQAVNHYNVRANVVTEDGRFYLFNKDTNDQPVKIINLDPLAKTQRQVAAPAWVQSYFSNYQNYGTPFLVIEDLPPS